MIKKKKRIANFDIFHFVDRNKRDQRQLDIIHFAQKDKVKNCHKSKVAKKFFFCLKNNTTRNG
jgi:hypothetical protein